MISLVIHFETLTYNLTQFAENSQINVKNEGNVFVELNNLFSYIIFMYII